MNLIVKIQAYEYLISMELGRRFQALSGTLLIISGAFGSFHKRFVKSIGQYDGDTITEDFDLTFKMRKLSLRGFTHIPSTRRRETRSPRFSGSSSP